MRTCACLFAHSSCTSLYILLFIKSTVYCIAHFILLHILLLILCSFILFLPIFIYIFSCVMFHFLHCPLSGPVLIYISLLIISCIIEYVTNKRTLNLDLAKFAVFLYFYFFLLNRLMMSVWNLWPQTLVKCMLIQYNVYCMKLYYFNKFTNYYFLLLIKL